MRILVAPSPEIRLLDLGGGAGRATERFATGCWSIVVLDPDRAKVVHGQRRRPQMSFMEGRAEQIPFPEDSFDRVTAVVAFHHVDDPERVLAETRRVLRPGGRTLLYELYPSRPGLLPKLFGGHAHGSGPVFYEPQQLKRILEEHAFRDVSIHHGRRGYFVAATK